ncbi:serine/threonine-protein kinase [Cellulomonas sp. P22]|uniref:serine/threonine-protein kinase n=1 Tax=Cellulomonas sp. P22 TaxID=3373189 RepID=UPI00378909D9
MTARREASTPPQIAGHRFIRVLGLGGFADVFLYEQDLPRRSVAVKVLLAGAIDDDVRSGFRTEANLMAQLSHHPSIVTIHHADIAPDGRPYLVMEYCSGPPLAERYRRERISVAEALRIGVRLGSAVETAHRAGILHRDIKPANVLTTDFGWPALTDFGIAATTGAGAGATLGMSIPWSPPELLAAHPHGDVRSDVYSLAATVYSLLAGRTPFEVPGGANGAADLVGRIERSALTSTGRGDVPPALQAVLVRAMSKDPAHRFASAAAFARALQQVEAAMGLAVTPLDLPDDHRGFGPAAPSAAAASSSADDGATRLRPVVSIDPEDRPVSGRRASAVPAVRLHALEPADVGHQPAARPASVDVAAPAPAPTDAPGSVAGPGPEHSSAVHETVIPQVVTPRRASRPLVVGVLSGVVVVGALATAAVVTLSGGATPGPSPATSDFAAPSAPGVVEAVPAPTDLVGERREDGTVVFTWHNPEPAEGDQYLWGVRTATGRPDLALVADPTVAVPPVAGAAPGEQVCIEVSIVRANRASSAQPAEGCAP